MKHLRRVLFSPTVAGLVILAACGRGERGSNDALKTTRPLDKATSAVGRNNGQKDFINLVKTWNSRNKSLNESGAEFSAPESARRSADAPAGGTVVEADVFSLQGDRLVVLHAGKGLSVITGLKRAKDGKILSFDKAYMVPDEKALENTPKLLFQWPEADLIVVIGERANRETGELGYVARLVDAAPGGKGYFAEQELNGSVVDQRLVTYGEEGVLYIASAIWDSKTSNQSGEISSYTVSKEGFKAVESKKLERAVAGNEVVQIAATSVNGKDKFYLLAPLATHWKVTRKDNQYRWEQVQGGLVSVDVSDPKGKLGSTVEIPVAGSIAKSGYMTMAGARLDVASQSQLGGTQAVAVEQAVIPEAGSVETVTEEEAINRQKAFDESLAAVYAAALEKRRAELKDPNYQLTAKEAKQLFAANYVEQLTKAKLNNAYVQKDDRLVKLKMDWSDYIVDPQGRTAESNGGAAVRDVRFLDNLIQVSWVPANQIDPVSIYDRGSADGKTPPRQVGEASFKEGFFVRILPFKAVHPGTKAEELFVIGYGTQPSKDGNSVMSKVFRLDERKDAKGEFFYYANEIGHAVFPGKNIQLDSRAQDRYVLYKYDPETMTASLLVQATQYGQEATVNGGIFVTYNIASTYENPFSSQGGRPLISFSDLIVGPEVDQVFRMFHTSGGAVGDAITALGKNATFFAGPGDKGNAFAKVLATIELIKNIAWYQTIGTGEAEVGLQFVQKSLSEQGVGYEPRLVSLDKVDANKSEALAIGQFIPGNYGASYKAANGDVVVVTTKAKTTTKQVQKPNGTTQDEYITEYFAYLTNLSLGKDKGGKPTVQSSPIEVKLSGYFQAAKISAAGENAVAVVLSTYEKAVDSVWVASNGGFKQLNIEDGASLDWLSEGQVSVVELQGKPYVVATQSVDVKDTDGSTIEVKTTGQYSYNLQQNYLIPIEVSNDGEEVALGRAINIPGQPLALVQDRYLLTDDVYAVEFRTSKEQKVDANGKVVVEDGKVQYVTVLSAIKDARQYSLVDLNGKSATYNGGRYELPEQQDFRIEPMFEARGKSVSNRMIRPRFYPIATIHTANDNQFVFAKSDNGYSSLVTLRATKNNQLKEVATLALSELLSEKVAANDYWTVVSAFARKDKDDLVVLSNYQTLVVVALNKGGVPKAVKVERLNGNYAERDDAVVLGPRSYGVGAQQLYYSDARNVFDVVDVGMSEVREYKIVE